MQPASSWTRPGWRFLRVEKEMDSVVHRCGSLEQQDIAFLEGMEGNLPILSDVSRADVLLYCPLTAERAVVVAQASAHPRRVVVSA
jgi:hypothetical protein